MLFIDVHSGEEIIQPNSRQNHLIVPRTTYQLISIAINDKAFRNFTPPRDLPTRIIDAIDNSSNSTKAIAEAFTPERKN